MFFSLANMAMTKVLIAVPTGQTTIKLRAGGFHRMKFVMLWRCEWLLQSIHY